MTKKYMHKKVSLLIICACLSFFDAGCHALKAPLKPNELWEAPTWERSLKDDDSAWRSIRENGEGAELSDSLTLIELIDIALNNNPSTHKAWYNARSKENIKAQARSDWYPAITFAGDFTKDKKVGNEKAGSSNTKTYGGTLSASLVVFDFGGRAASLKEAYHSVLAANFEFNQSVQDLVLSVETNYYDFYSAKSNLVAAKADVADAKATYDAAEQKLQAGISTQLDSLQAKSNYDESLFQLEEARGAVETARANLAESLGVSADTDFDVISPSWKMPTDLTKEDVSALIEEAMRKRADVSASRANVLGAQDTVKSAFSDLFPSLSVGTTGAKRWTETFGASKGYQDYYEYTGFLKVSWDIFDGFKNYAQLLEAKNNAKAEREQLIADELAASADVWTKYYSFKTAVRKFDFGKAFLRSSEESYALAFESYRSGVKNILDVLDAQSSLAKARSKLITSENDLLVSFAEMAHSTGSLGTGGSGKYTNTKD